MIRPQRASRATSTIGANVQWMPGRGRLGRRHARRPLDRRRVPARRLAERDREDRLVAVDHVVAEDHRDLEPAVLDRELLHLARGLGAVHVQHRADEPLPDLVVHRLLRPRARRRAGHVEGAAVLVELPDLLLERHLREERVDLLLGRRVDEALGPGPRNECELTARARLRTGPRASRPSLGEPPSGRERPSDSTPRPPGPNRARRTIDSPRAGP